MSSSPVALWIPFFLNNSAYIRIAINYWGFLYYVLIINTSDSVYNYVILMLACFDDNSSHLFISLMFSFHPDRSVDDIETSEQFKEVSNSYDILSDRDGRRCYDNGELSVAGPHSGCRGGTALLR
uniref:J domain-containing protein n=1 Tax=Ananas comosus var. bracteatus TaxID=296719 RepID=A0A6V7PDC1_ANACO|nr:unnamed protein product [Ananas comosus var. bracteatus]